MRAFILLALLGTAVAVPRRTVGVDARIVGGADARIEQYPFMANLQRQWLGVVWSTACGGALLTSRTLLTAAHCFDGERVSDWRARVGHTNQGEGDIHHFEAFTIHESFNPTTLDYDVAVGRLATPVTFSATVGTARIAGAAYVLADNTPVTALGWGTLYANGPTPIALQQATVNTISLEVCRTRYAFLATLPGMGTTPAVTENMLCAGVLDVGGRDACQGDDGGPLIHGGDVVYGVMSWGAGCADPVFPGVHAAVYRLSEWITVHATA